MSCHGLSILTATYADQGCALRCIGAFINVQLMGAFAFVNRIGKVYGKSEHQPIQRGITMVAPIYFGKGDSTAGVIGG
jgi:hypothetical protein